MNGNMHLTLLFSEEQIRERISELARQIVADYIDLTPVLIGVLNGSFIFLADLVRELNKNDLSCCVDFIRAASYGSGMTSSGDPRISPGNSFQVTDRHVLLVDDILDTGLTFQAIREEMVRQHPADIRSCVCFDRPGRRKVDIQADYVGFAVPEAFIVGYGLDYGGQFRELPFVSILSLS